MLFNSNIFLFLFLPVFLLFYYLLPVRYRSILVLTAGLVFFFWGAPKFTIVLLISCFLDFLLSHSFQNQKRGMAKSLFVAGIVYNLGLLIYYKYTGFFIRNFELLLQGESGNRFSSALQIIMPIGISFIIFHKISFLTDVYRRKKPAGNIIRYLNYIFFFPKLLAGPILLWKDAFEQFGSPKDPDINDKLNGFYRFCLGLFKKVWIANILGNELNPLFTSGFNDASIATFWIMIVSYSMQLLFDFSAYTDMALGLSKMLGYYMPENFNSPYASSSIRDFWKRWHMSLTAWFREYLFLPLAYRFSARLKNEKYLMLKTDYIIYAFAVFITFVLTGFWHGAAWTFIIWGAYHGILLIADRLFLNKAFRKTGKFLSVFITFWLVTFGWIIFRVSDVNEFKLIVHGLFSAKPGVYHFSLLFYYGLAVAVLFSSLPYFRISGRLNDFWLKGSGTSAHLVKALVSIVFLLASMAGISANGFNPFIYFRF